MFEGTITVSNNPISTIGDRYSKTFSPVYIPGKEGFRGFSKQTRADANFWRVDFLLTGGKNFLDEFLLNALSRDIRVTDEENQPLWEGLIFEMELNTGAALYRMSLAEMYNRAWIRYRITGAGAPTISTPLEDLYSQARYSIREYVMTGGELQNAAVADQPVQRFLNAHQRPKPVPLQLGLSGMRQDFQIKGVTDRPHIRVKCRGYDDTLDWQIYENAGAGEQGASAQIGDVLTAKAQFVASRFLQSNSTPVSTQYETDRKAGGIIRDITRLGDSGAQRWVSYFTFNRHFIYEAAAPAQWKEA